MKRVIFHVDMNSFFASCEIAQDASLKGKPVVVGGQSKRRAVITTASYEARQFGVRSAMPVSQALRLCPQLIVLPVNHELYREYSKKVMEIIHRFCQRVEQGSIDEAYLDMSKLASKDSKYILQVARKIQVTIYEELGLGSSIGIGESKFVAKMASDMKKPMGITLIHQDDIQNYIWTLPLSKMYGVGPKTHQVLKDIFQVETIGDFAQLTKEQIIELGRDGYVELWEKANGIDYREVSPERYEDMSSIGVSRTFLVDTDQEDDILEQFNLMVERVIKRLQKREYYAQTVQITLRNSQFKTITRAQTLSQPFNDSETLEQVVQSLFLNPWNGDTIRLIGVSVSHFETEKRQMEQMTIDHFL